MIGLPVETEHNGEKHQKETRKEYRRVDRVVVEPQSKGTSQEKDRGMDEAPVAKGPVIEVEKESAENLEARKMKSVIRHESGTTSEASVSSTPKTPRAPEEPPEIQNDPQNSVLRKDGEPEDLRGEEREKLPFTYTEPSESAIPQSRRLPPPTLFKFGSLPPSRANPLTPVKTKERRVIVSDDSKDDGTNGSPSPEKELDNRPPRTDPQFVWNPRLLKEKGKTDIQQGMSGVIPKRVHRSSEVAENFWVEGGFNPPPGYAIRRGRVFPILFSAAETGDKPENVRILSPRREEFSTFRQVSTIEGKQDWSKKEVLNSILEETALALRKIIINTHNRTNPLRVWESACWHFKWIQDEANGSAHCVILGFIPSIAEGITLQRPDNFRWIKAPSAVGEMLLDQNSLGQLAEAKEVPIEVVQYLVGKDLTEQDPSPPRPVFKRGRQETELEKDNQQNGIPAYPEGQPQEPKNQINAE